MIIFNTPCEILGGYQDMKPGVVVRKLGVLIPLGCLDNSLVCETFLMH